MRLGSDTAVAVAPDHRVARRLSRAVPATALDCLRGLVADTDPLPVQLVHGDVRSASLPCGVDILGPWFLVMLTGGKEVR